jgi:hypothetical protein
MKISRSDFLKLFGIGAVVVPVVGGTLDTENAAKLIAEPQVNPILLPSRNISTGYGGVNPMGGSQPIKVTIEHPQIGHTITLKAHIVNLQMAPRAPNAADPQYAGPGGWSVAAINDCHLTIEALVHTHEVGDIILTMPQTTQAYYPPDKNRRR